MSQTNQINDPEKGIKPVINPFWAFVLYLVAVHYFCFSIWPLAWWHICDIFGLLDRLTARQFVDIASKISFSTGFLLLFVCFAAGYNTTDHGATKQLGTPPRAFKKAANFLNEHLWATLLLMAFIFLVPSLVVQNNMAAQVWGPELFYTEVKEARLVFPDFLSYFNTFGSRGRFNIFFPFDGNSLMSFAVLYWFFLTFWFIHNLTPFFIIIEPLNHHIWQKISFAINQIRRG